MERSEARALSLSKYYTGRPCKQGHLGYRYTQSGTCSECINPKSYKEPPKQYDSRYMERPEAVKLGLSKYTTGRPCNNGHLTYRYTVSGSCSDCRLKFVKPPKHYDPRYTERAEAIEKGMSQYTTGRPCKRGHLTYRYTVSGSCSDCRPKFVKPPKQYDPRYMERPEAVEKGMSQYTTGRPCKQGHLTYRYTVSGSCSACVRPKFEKRTDPDFVNMRIRVRDKHVGEVDAIMHFMAITRVPSLTMRYVTFNGRRTSVACGTSIRHYRVHKDDHDSLKAMLVAKFNKG